MRSYVRGTLSRLPRGLRASAADDVAADALEALCRRRERIAAPERAMYRVARRLAWGRFPLDPREAPAGLLETEEAAEDATDALVDRLVLEEEFAKLPQKTRRCLCEHKALGRTAEEAADDCGAAKGTVTQSARRGLEAVHPAFDCVRLLEAVAGFVRRIVDLAVDGFVFWWTS
ncbi:hypothetical protein ABT090_36980 [Streptomyces asoensis]|uniref:hypothetical protein n=1 Tax=Streptomyces asoensis TaxID=249586 RepID=UPI003330CAB0